MAAIDVIRGGYRRIAKPVLFRMSPDTAHGLLTAGLRASAVIPGVPSLTRKLLRYDHPSLEQELWGIRFRLPAGLSAGFDPDGRQAASYANLGFGFAELGSATRYAQPGNPRPHYTRLKLDQGIIVHKGLMNAGIEKLAERVEGLRAKRRIDYPVGLSVARTTAIPDEDTVKDYVEAFRIAAPAADYVTLNVSCPNVACFPPDVQLGYVGEILEQVAAARKALARDVPVWIKFGPDETGDTYLKMLELCVRHGVDAISLTNLIKDRSKITIKSPATAKGGISGKLLAPFAKDRLAFFARELKGTGPKLVSIGGIFSAEDAYERITLGASLLQLITGWIYEGPTLPRDIAAGMAKLLERDGHRSITDAVGAATR